MRLFRSMAIIIIFFTSSLRADVGYGFSEVGILSSMPPMTTIITHGFNLDVGTPEWSNYKWQFSMADAIAPDRQILLLRKGKFYLSNLDYEGYQSLPDDRSIDDIVNNLFLSESDFTLNSKRNVVIIFDWVEESDFLAFGWAEAAGETLAVSLLRLAEKYPWVLKKLHFIGHSRGTVVNSEAIQRLIYYASHGYIKSVKLDKNIHMTTLDAHPAGHWLYAPQHDDEVNSKELGVGVSGWIGGEYSTTYMDNYYETTGRTGAGLILIGLDYFPGLNYSYNLDEKFGNADSTHSLVHTWYHGTVDTKALKDEFGSGKLIKDSWYNQRNNEGFANSFLRKNDLSAIASNQNALTPVEDFGHFNDSKLIFNGDFLINSYGNEYYTPGWNLQGGSGGASVYFTHLDLNWIYPEKTHNYFLIAKDKLYFSVSVTKKSQDDELHVQLIDQNDNVVIDKVIPLTWYTSFKNYSMDVSKYLGTVKRLRFKIVNNGLMVDSEVLIDNVGFERYDNMEAVISLDTGNSSKNSLMKVSGENDVYLHVYDINGNHTGQINDSTWVTEIPGSYYYVSPDTIDKPFKAIYLPKPENGQEYTFKIERQRRFRNSGFYDNRFF